MESAQRELSRPDAAVLTFDDFVRDHQLALVRYAMLLTGSRAPAEDLVQDVLVRIYPRWDLLVNASGSVTAYVRRAVTNEYLSWRRRWSTRHIQFVDHERLPDNPDRSEHSDRDEELWARLLRLPGQQRAAVVLRFYEGLSDAEIGEVLGCRPPSVRGHISRGLARLRAGSTGSIDEIKPTGGDV